MSQNTLLVLTCLSAVLSGINGQSESPVKQYTVDTVSSQCVKLNSTYVGACHEEVDYPAELRCTNLRCAVPQNETVSAIPEFVGPAAVGTACGPNKVCIDEKCTEAPNGVVYNYVGIDTLSHCHPEGDEVDGKITITMSNDFFVQMMEVGDTDETTQGTTANPKTTPLPENTKAPETAEVAESSKTEEIPKITRAPENAQTTQSQAS